ncbi:MAG: hypothetical protein E7304_07460 [Butyrivibrio sp.]|jgi:hypothetical protein|uniref:phospholipase D family protein n=1 Tax=Butyrivibrio sp. TaxID=28121 RepID=UPI001ED3012E|nr:phospholipase D family protein [Butyrivibrio sp.]MBE5841224.1 hypothetical protein [Butyrivibrio sp.]
MGLLLTVRSTDTTSYFKEIMHEMFHVFQPDEILLCSGFYQEKHSTYSPYYQVSLDVSSAGVDLEHLLSHIEKVTLVGIHGSNTEWLDSYKNFYMNIKKKNPKIVAYKSKDNNWHAKIMIFRRNGKSVACIIGSSNMTKSAYESKAGINFNIESDVYIYDNSKDVEMLNIATTLRSRESTSSIIVGNYSPQMNGNLSEVEIIDDYYNNIIKSLKSSDFEQLRE